MDAKISELIEHLKLDSEMLRDGHQKNLTKLWHSAVVKDAAKTSAEAADALASLQDRVKKLHEHLTFARKLLVVQMAVLGQDVEGSPLIAEMDAALQQERPDV